MSYKIFTTPVFEKQLKRLSKKYSSLKNEYSNFLDELEENPIQGKALGKNCYKIRLAIASKGKGKSGGARVIFHLVISDESVYLLTIYDKSEKESIDDAELKDLLQQIVDLEN